jgi:DivIVA domain-containing protein
MSSAELDLPVLVTPEQIRRREFVTTRRGYDVEQVRDYLDQLAQQVEQMETLLRGARLQAGAVERAQAAPRKDPYQQLSERFADVLRTTDREADRVRREAKEEADRVLREARADADRIRLDASSRAEQAREEAERALREARSQADRTIAGLANRRDALVEQLAAMQERLLGVAHELEAAIVRPEDEAALLASLEAAAADVAAGDPTKPSDAGPVESEPVEVHDGDDAAEAVDEPPPVDTTTTIVDLARGEKTIEELWSSADPDDLRIPEIPPLELDWDQREPD